MALTLCDDKRLPHQTLAEHGIRVPRQLTAQDDEQDIAFMEQVERVVVKPARRNSGDRFGNEKMVSGLSCVDT